MEARTNEPAPIPEMPSEVVWRRIDELEGEPKNPPPYNSDQIRQLAKSIAAFGFNVPILVSSGSRVIAGYWKLLAARELGWHAVPTIRRDHLSPAQAHVFISADNRLARTASWDDLLLVMQLKELSPSDQGSGEPSRGALGRPRPIRRTRPALARSLAADRA